MFYQIAGTDGLYPPVSTAAAGARIAIDPLCWAEMRRRRADTWASGDAGVIQSRPDRATAIAINAEHIGDGLAAPAGVSGYPASTTRRYWFSTA